MTKETQFIISDYLDPVMLTNHAFQLQNTRPEVTRARMEVKKT